MTGSPSKWHLKNQSQRGCRQPPARPRSALCHVRRRSRKWWRMRSNISIGGSGNCALPGPKSWPWPHASRSLNSKLERRSAIAFVRPPWSTARTAPGGRPAAAAFPNTLAPRFKRQSCSPSQGFQPFVALSSKANIAAGGGGLYIMPFQSAGCAANAPIALGGRVRNCRIDNSALGSGSDERAKRADRAECDASPAMLRQAACARRGSAWRLGQLLFGGHDRHVTAEMLHAEAVPAGEHVSLATVYNTLHQFKRAGPVARDRDRRRQGLFRHQHVEPQSFLRRRRRRAGGHPGQFDPGRRRARAAGRDLKIAPHRRGRAPGFQERPLREARYVSRFTISSPRRPRAFSARRSRRKVPTEIRHQRPLQSMTLAITPASMLAMVAALSRSSSRIGTAVCGLPASSPTAAPAPYAGLTEAIADPAGRSVRGAHLAPALVIRFRISTGSPARRKTQAVGKSVPGPCCKLHPVGFQADKAGDWQAAAATAGGGPGLPMPAAPTTGPSPAGRPPQQGGEVISAMLIQSRPFRACRALELADQFKPSGAPGRVRRLMPGNELPQLLQLVIAKAFC